MKAASIKSGLMASTMAIFGALGAAWFFAVPAWGDPNLLNMSIISGCAGLVSFFLTAAWVEKRKSRNLAPLGFLRGGLLAVVVLIAATSIHALLYGGAGGFIVSLMGQILFALITLGWLVFLIGGVVGITINRLFGPRGNRPNNRFNSDAGKARAG